MPGLKATNIPLRGRCAAVSDAVACIKDLSSLLALHQLGETQFNVPLLDVEVRGQALQGPFAVAIEITCHPWR